MPLSGHNKKSLEIKKLCHRGPGFYPRQSNKEGKLLTPLPLLLGVIFLVAAGVVGLLFWIRFKRYKVRAAAKPEPQPPPVPESELFRQETAEELGIPLITPTPAPAEQPRRQLELPRTYGVDRIVLMVRDPYWLFAYWEVSATKQEEFNQQYGPTAWSTTQPVLRIYDVTGIDFNGYNARSYIDIQVSDQVDNWHIYIGKPEHSFCVDLGRKFPDGRFVTILRSNVVVTPRDNLSDLLDEEWMWIEGIYGYSRYQVGISSPLIFEEMAERIEAVKAVPVGIFSPGMPPLRKE